MAGINASKECVVDIYQDAMTTLKDYVMIAGEKVGEVLEPSMKVRDEVSALLLLSHLTDC